jgi:hypothetical protein
LGIHLKADIGDTAALRGRGAVSGLKKFADEGTVIGRLLTGYADLELDLFHCVHVATGDFDGAMRAMFGTRGETRRINEGVKLGRPVYQALALETEFDDAVTATRQCLRIRNQYAHHTFWDDNSGQLAIGALEEVAKQPTPVRDLHSVKVEHVDVPLLQSQERYFAYADGLLAWVNFEGRARAANVRSNPVPMPVRVVTPRLHL